MGEEGVVSRVKEKRGGREEGERGGGLLGIRSRSFVRSLSHTRLWSGDARRAQLPRLASGEGRHLQECAIGGIKYSCKGDNNSRGEKERLTRPKRNERRRRARHRSTKVLALPPPFPLLA